MISKIFPDREPMNDSSIIVIQMVYKKNFCDEKVCVMRFCGVRGFCTKDQEIL